MAARPSSLPPIRLSARSSHVRPLQHNTHKITNTHIIHKGITILNAIVIVERYNEYRIKVVELSSSLSLTGLTSFYLLISYSFLHSTNASSPLPLIVLVRRSSPDRRRIRSTATILCVARVYSAHVPSCLLRWP